MLEKQEMAFDFVLDSLSLLSPGQLDFIQHQIRNMLQELDLETEKSRY
ncbi:hypothetical protein UFOVP1437_31 [uncultured Caudovirales phage]|uniref:Uncharacterized protein n=1 Tax=uncultured Caudovirales phage TaxID=2100421 RepID=A0A6J5SDW3_9CAUD|nr:hypothetical protein UFOVP1437_31 [uncultured Caudovirales phage]CAB5228139.1 hypothetical protein UFOVP1531_33 [uncultured Caudovirales phage]